MDFSFAYPQMPIYYDTTYLKTTFPEHRHLLEGMRHKLGTAIFQNPEIEIRNPHVDIRETQEKYYIDVELPGLENKEELSLKWTGSRTLLVKAIIKRREVAEQLGDTTNAEISDTGSGQKTIPGSNDQEHQEKTTPTSPVHFIVRERKVGHYDRAFNFPVDIDHDSLVAKLQFGILEIAVMKLKYEDMKDKKIEVHHTGL